MTYAVVGLRANGSRRVFARRASPASAELAVRLMRGSLEFVELQVVPEELAPAPLQGLMPGASPLARLVERAAT